MTTTDREQSVVAAVPKDLFIDGQWRRAESGRKFAVEDPATGDTLTQVADGDARAALTPLSMNALAAILAEAGLPAGVCNVVSTTSAGSTVAGILDDPQLRKLSFTGSTEVGRQLIASASSQILRVSMELGGNAPFV